MCFLLRTSAEEGDESLAVDPARVARYGPRNTTSVGTAAGAYYTMLGNTALTDRDDRAARELRRPFLPFTTHDGEVNIADRVTRYNRDYLGRVVRYFASQGIRQVLDIGCGLPAYGNVHEIVGEALSEGERAAVVYVDYERIVVDRWRDHLEGHNRHPGLDVAVVHADMRQPDSVLTDPVTTRLLDFSQPVLLLMISLLQYIHPEDGCYELVEQYTAPLAPGSVFALSHGTGDNLPDDMRAPFYELKLAYEEYIAENFTLRVEPQVRRFFGTWPLVPPGLVRLQDWRPGEPGYVPDTRDPARHIMYGGAAVKPEPGPNARS